MKVYRVIVPEGVAFELVCVGYVMLEEQASVIVSLSDGRLIEDEELSSRLDFWPDDAGTYKAQVLPPLNPI